MRNFDLVKDSLEEQKKSLELVKQEKEHVIQDVHHLQWLRSNHSKTLASLKQRLNESSLISLMELKQTKQGKEKPWYEIDAGDAVGPLIMKILALSMPRSNLSTKSYRLVNILWSDEFLGGFAQKQMIETVKRYLQDNVFLAQAL